MKNNLIKTFLALFLVIMMFSCKKEAPLNAENSTINLDNPVANTELDQWLRTTFLDEYNIDVVYRYNRFLHGNDKDIAAVNVDKVRPQMENILQGFILPYRKIAGATFIKRLVPKQFVLYGSPSYNTDGSAIAATASAGRNITMYNVNNFDVNSAAANFDKLRTIHHEFTHTLNQIVPMPADFQTITKSTYLATWTTTPDAAARANGYVTSYASSSPFEDFAETTAYLLVNGQAWFDLRAAGAGAAGKAALKAKEASVVQYFTINLGVDFRALQREIQGIVRDGYKYIPTSFGYFVGQDLGAAADKAILRTLTINLEDALYVKYGISTEFAAAYNNFKTQVAASPAFYAYHVDNIQLRFESATSMVVRLAFTGTQNIGPTQYMADFSFSFTSNSNTGELVFTKIAQGTGTTFGNATQFLTAFTNTLQPYLTGKTFIADWIPKNVSTTDFNTFGGFYVKGNSANYFYGQFAY
ncbi:substrate import-associated zinc metallohydrolase lipoprotein [Pedobacter jeongneungensis]|uniref:substrate import-associated zinc metallohydrolase lipoprotein n=1 Tax=Pedobacter jeongneungensis TaxID=947309 RepID=UPI00046A2120|nr:substrate import-associated zinc metallohydrolase lipoprotein [Pedobacter jeongneungensis]